MITKTITYTDTCDIGKSKGGEPYQVTVAMREGVHRREGDEYPLDASNSTEVPNSEMTWELALHQKDNTVSADDFKAPSWPLLHGL